MRIGMICPYSFDVAGGVQAHVVDLARVLIERGHEVSVLTPSSKETVLPDFAVSSGKAVAIPYNGSVSRLSFGPKAFARLRKWIRRGEFDVLHVHEPNAPSLGMLALAIADGPIVATFHTSTEKSLVLSVFQSVLRPSHEKIRGKIAVSELARRWQMESLGSDAIEIPNGVDVRTFADAEPLPGYPRAGKTVLFLGRYDEPRKGMAVFLEALPAIVAAQPDVEVLVIGPRRRGEAAARGRPVRRAPAADGRRHRRGEGLRPALRRRLRRPEPRRRELRHRARRGHGGRDRRRREQPQRLRAGARRGRGRAPVPGGRRCRPRPHHRRPARRRLPPRRTRHPRLRGGLALRLVRRGRAGDPRLRDRRRARRGRVDRD